MHREVTCTGQLFPVTSEGAGKFRTGPWTQQSTGIHDVDNLLFLLLFCFLTFLMLAFEAHVYTL